MKTIKKITKKKIWETLKSQNRTAIYKLVKEIKGKANKVEVMDFIRENSKTEKIYKRAYEIAYGTIEEWCQRSWHNKNNKHGYFEPLKKQEIVEYLKKQTSKPINNYTKLPFYGITHLYFCSPIYVHRDYNKWCAIPIKGNEKFCELIINYAHKKIQY